jgi:hypothetical protein
MCVSREIRPECKNMSLVPVTLTRSERKALVQGKSKAR